MPIPDAESLRREYNEHFRQPVDRWSCVDPAEAAKIAGLVRQRLASDGITSRSLPSALDVGCAKGHITEALRLASFEAHGLDFSDVAIATAKQLFPRCQFHHGDGFNPRFDRQFDLVFMRGFSGCNTLDMEAIAELANKYVELLNPGGWLVIGYSTDFSGRQRPGDTACWSPKQIRLLSSRVHARDADAVTVPPRRWHRTLKMRIGRMMGRHPKYYLYLFYNKDGSTLSRDNAA